MIETTTVFVLFVWCMIAGMVTVTFLGVLEWLLDNVILRVLSDLVYRIERKKQ